MKNKENVLAKQKSIDYILGMITGASIMLAAWAGTNGTHLNAARSMEQEVKVVNERWNPVYVEIID